MILNLLLEDTLQLFSRRKEKRATKFLEVKDLEKTKDGELLFSNVDLKLKKGDKVAIISKNTLAISEFFEILSGNATADKGEF